MMMSACRDRGLINDIFFGLFFFLPIELLLDRVCPIANC